MANTHIVCVLVAALSVACSADSADEAQQVRNSMTAYRDAWLRGDQAGVLDGVAGDIVLHMPTPSGKPVVGKEAVTVFWFPATDVSYPITTYEVSQEEIIVHGDLALYSGISRLSWHTLRGEVRSDSATAVSEFLNVLKREEGRWRLVRIMYNIKDPYYGVTR
jgi:ketosteroid isomerase-like protein